MNKEQETTVRRKRETNRFYKPDPENPKRRIAGEHWIELGSYDLRDTCKHETIEAVCLKGSHVLDAGWYCTCKGCHKPIEPLFDDQWRPF